jgi:hypothetical protein
MYVSFGGRVALINSVLTSIFFLCLLWKCQFVFEKNCEALIAGWGEVEKENIMSKMVGGVQARRVWRSWDQRPSIARQDSST